MHYTLLTSSLCNSTVTHRATRSCANIMGFQKLCLRHPHLPLCPPVPTLKCSHMPGFSKKHVASTELCPDNLCPSDCTYPTLCLFPLRSLPLLLPPAIPSFSLEGICYVRCPLFLGPAVCEKVQGLPTWQEKA